MDDENGESMEPMEEVPLKGLGELELEMVMFTLEFPSAWFSSV